MTDDMTFNSRKERSKARPRVVVPCALRPEQAERLRALSLREDLSQATLIRRAVDRLIREEEAEPRR